MPWKVPITVDGLTYPVEFGGDSEPSESDINAAVQQILAQSEQPPKEVPGYLSQLGTALSIGGRQMTAGVKGTFNALTGDDADTAEAMARMGALQREQEQAQTPQDIALTREFAKSKAAYDKAQGVWDTAEALSGYFGDVAEYPGAAFKQAVQSAPNAVIGTGTSIAGYALGGLLGAGAGAETGPGAILTGIAGAAAGGAVSNSLMEAGPAIYDVLNERTNGAAANMTAEQIAEVLRKDPTITSEGLKTGAIRGTVIGLVESLGMKGAGSILTIPERAAARAAQKTLMDAGVDVASKEAVEAAMKNVALRKSVSDAASTAKSQFTSAGNLARGAAATTIETASAGAGEVAAQVAAGQEIDPTAAVQEMIGEVGINAALTPAVKAAELAKRKPVTPAPDTDFARRAAMEGATEFRDTTAGSPVVVEGITIATIPPGSSLSPDDVAAFAGMPDGPAILKRYADQGRIVLPEIVKPVENVDKTLTDEMSQNIAAGAANARATVEELKKQEAQRLAEEGQTALPIEDVAGVIYDLRSAETGTALDLDELEMALDNVERRLQKGKPIDWPTDRIWLPNISTASVPALMKLLGSGEGIAAMRRRIEELRQQEAERAAAEEQEAQRIAEEEQTAAREAEERQKRYEAMRAEQSVKLELTPDESGATGAGMKEEIQQTPISREIAEEDRAEFEELQDLMTRRGQAQNKVRNVQFSKKDEARFQELGAKLKRYLFETVDPANDPVVGEDINDQPIQQSEQGTFYTVENGRVRTGPAFKPDPEYSRQQDEIIRQEKAAKAPAPQPITLTGEPQSIPLDQLTVIPEDMARAEASRDANDERWQRASQSKEPIRAIRRPDGTLRIMDGHHRYLAARDRGDASIPVTIEPPFTPAQGKPTDSLPADQPTSGDVGTGAAVQRDPSKPEQMTPEERFNRSPAGVVRPKSLPLGTSKKSTRSRLLAQFDRGAAWADKNDSEKAELSSFQKRNDLFKTRQRNGHFGTDKAAEDYAFWRGAAAFFEAKQANSERRAERSLSGTQKVAQHSDDILIALDSNDPVSAEAVDTYGIKLPEGYVRQGELYVFQPTSGDVGKPMASDYTFSKSFSNDPAYLAGQRSKWRELFGKPAETVTLTDVDRVAAKKKWSKQTKDIYIQERKPLVESALREGKPVPAEVLADYPDLKPPAPRSPAPTPSTAETRGAEDEPFGKLPTEEVETELSRRTKQAEEEEAREKIEAPKRRAEAIQTFVSEGAVVQTRKRVVGRAKAREGGGDVTRTEHFLVHPDRREIPLSASEAKKVSTAAPRSPAENLVSFTAANGQKLVGEVQSVTGNKATVAYQWNGKTKTQVVPVSQLGSPVASVATPPKYQYNQEQNTRKLGKHFPTALGVHANHDFRKSFASMAKDTALGQDYQMIAKLLSNMPEFKNMDLHLVADENIDYAGEYSWNRGKPSIAINLRLIARGQVDALGSILHEALHHVTLAKVRNPQGAFENEVVSKLDLIRESVREYAESRGYAEALEYELGSTEEFITALFTRPDFQAFIASIPDSAAPAVAVGKFRSLLSEIFRLIAELVHGKPVLRGSALEQAMTTSLALFNTPFRAIETGGLEALNAARSYAGERAQMPQFMRDSLETAQAMAAAGKTSEEIRAVTGWFPGKYDGKMRWEIPDEGATWTEVARGLLEGTEEKSAKLGDVLRHDALFDAYPDLKDAAVSVQSLGASDSTAEWVPYANAVILNRDILRDGGNTLSVVLHELQHAIQGIEGFAKGASPGSYVGADKFYQDWVLRAELVQLADETGKTLSEAVEMYKDFPEDYASLKNALEVFTPIEARDVQARQNFTPEQRKAVAPYSSENIAKEDAIVMFGGSGAQASMGKGIKALFPQTGDKAAKPPELGERWWATTTRAEARSVLEPAALEELKAIAVRMDTNPNQPKAKLIDRLVQITGVYADAVGIRGADAVGPRGAMPDYTGQAEAAQQLMREQRAARAQQPKERGLPKKAKPRTPEEFARDMAALMARPATGGKPINLSAAYQKAATGKSSQWVTIKEVYEQAKAADPALTPEAFMQFVQQQNDAGGVMISPVENVSTVEAAQPFVIGNAGVEMIVPESSSPIYAAPIDTQPRTGDSDAEAGGSEMSAPISSELDARRKEAISAAVAQNDWGNYTREQKVAAAESFLAERVRGLGIFSPPHELLSRVTAGDPGGSYVRVDSADSKSLGVTINVGQGAGIDKYANFSPQEVFAHLYDIAQEEGIHVLQYMGLHRKWVESGAKGGTAGFLRLIEKEFKTTFDQINKARIDLQQTDPAAAQKIKDAMLASWNLYHAQDPVAGISGLWDRLGQSAEMQANFTLEMVRMLTQLKRQDFTTETGWQKFRSMIKRWLTDAINALRGVQDVFRSGMAGDLIQRQLADLEAALDGKPLPPVSRPAASRADDGEGVIDIGGEAEPADGGGTQLFKKRETAIGTTFITPADITLQERRSQEETLAKARKIIAEEVQKDEKGGRAVALQRFRSDMSIPPEVRTAGSGLIAQQADLLANLERDAIQQEGLDALADEAGKVSGIIGSDLEYWRNLQLAANLDIDKMAMEAGRTLNIFNVFRRLTPEGFLRRMKRQYNATVQESISQNFDIPPGEVEAEIMRLWRMMREAGATARGEAIAAALKSFMPRRVNTRRIIESLFPQAGTRQRMSKGGEALVRNFFQMMAGPRDQKGPLAEFDESIQNALSGMLRKVMEANGLVAKNQSKQATDIDKLVRSVSADELRFDKIAAADEAMQKELDAIEDPERRSTLRQAWEEATAKMYTNIASDATVRRAINSELKGMNVDWRKMFDSNQKPDAVKAKVVDAVMTKIEGLLTDAADPTVRQNLNMLRGEVEAAFDFIAANKRTEWLAYREGIEARRRVAEHRAAFMEALRNQGVAEDALLRISKKLLAGPLPQKPDQNPVSALVGEHMKEKVPNFVDKLVALDVDRATAEQLDTAAKALRADIAEVEKLKAAERAVKKLMDSLKPKPRAPREKIEKALKALFTAAETGALDSQEFFGALGEALGHPPLTAEQQAKIKKLTREINSLPKGAARVDKQQELDEELALWKGIAARDVLLSAWYANILSGISTQGMGLQGNSLNMALRSFFLAITNPRSAKAYFQGVFGEGLETGLREAKAAMKGRGLYKVSKYGDKNLIGMLELLRKKGPATLPEWIAYIASGGTRLRYVFRIMQAIDALAWNTAREGHAYLAAHRALLDQQRAGAKRSPEEFYRAFVESLGGDAKQIEEDMRTAREELISRGQTPDLTTIARMAGEARNARRSSTVNKMSNRFADRIVMQQDPEGSGRVIHHLINVIQREVEALGVPFGQLLVPFNKIVSSLFEQSLDYTPVGALRSYLGGHLTDVQSIDWSGKVQFKDKSVQFDAVERAERMAASVTGTLAASVMFALASLFKDEPDEDVPFMLYGLGPESKNKRDQMPKGWTPYSMKWGDTYIKFSEMPFGVMFAAAGNALDAMRYKNMDNKSSAQRLAYVLKTSAKGFTEQGVLSSFDTALEVLTFQASDKKFTDVPVNIAKGMVPGQGMLRDISVLFDPVKIKDDTIAAAFLRDFPVVRRIGTRPALNVFGEPMTFDGRIPFVRRIGTLREKHPVADYLGRNGLSIPGMAQTIVVGQYLPKDMKDRIQRRALQTSAMENGVFTVEQDYNFRKRAGELTKAAVEGLLTQVPTITSDRQRENVQNLINRKVEIARRRAMLEAVPAQ
jgi:hypothetical protein